MRHPAVLALALLPLSGLACGSSPNAPGNVAPVVVGRVVDLTTGIGVPDAIVTFADASDTFNADNWGQAAADASGRYQLSLTAAGLYAVHVDNLYIGQVRAHSGINEADLLVHDNGCPVRYGTIADAETGRPLEGARVLLLGVSATSEADGGYRLDLGCRTKFGTGTLIMTVMRSGYQDATASMGRREAFNGVIRQDVDLEHR